MVRSLVVLALLSALFLTPAPAQTHSSNADPALTGYVTRCVSNNDFDVNGLRILSTPTSEFFHGSPQIRIHGGNAFFGEKVAIYGSIDNKKHQITATRIVFIDPDPHTLSGIAVVDRVFKSASSGTVLLRADGYVMEVPPTAKTHVNPPLNTLADIQPNVWIVYHGNLRSNGVLSLDEVVFQSNDVSKREAKLVQITDYDPAAVASDAKQNRLSKAFIGIDPKKTPPYDNPQMQQRVSKIGESLIPSYQRTLSPQDPSKISFRFQVVDYKYIHDAMALPSGVILVPFQVVERMQNDSQLAAVLADNIGAVVEKQTYRLMPAKLTLSSVQLATSAAGFFVPGAAIVGLSTLPASKSIDEGLLNQSGRMGLVLMHDAGYDIQQAPVAWWILASKPSKTLAETSLPARSGNLYQAISFLWKNYPEPTSIAPPQTSSTQ